MAVDNNCTASPQGFSDVSHVPKIKWWRKGEQTPLQARQHNSSPAFRAALTKGSIDPIFGTWKVNPKCRANIPLWGSLISPLDQRLPSFPQLLAAASWSHHHSLLSQARDSSGKAISFPCTFPGFLWVCVPSPASLYPINIPWLSSHLQTIWSPTTSTSPLPQKLPSAVFKS